ncbi:hypothetical protein BGZ60DRAFT_406961 [Tricladium varicosporioides]|nr:hypothetical protein BGZ60DRAFT_406961 [Hymenoscyphus varicosporioides]
MYHLDIDIFSIPTSKKAVITSSTISLGRHFITLFSSSENSFLTRFSKIKYRLVNYTNPY